MVQYVYTEGQNQASRPEKYIFLHGHGVKQNKSSKCQIPRKFVKCIIYNSVFCCWKHLYVCLMFNTSNNILTLPLLSRMPLQTFLTFSPPLSYRMAGVNAKVLTTYLKGTQGLEYKECTKNGWKSAKVITPKVKPILLIRREKIPHTGDIKFLDRCG